MAPTQKPEAQQQPGPTTMAPAGGAPAAGTQAPPKQAPLQINAKSIVDVVGGRIQQFLQSGQLHLPKDYSPENALKSAWLVLQGVVDRDKRPALTVCSKDSIANALLDMIVQGLNVGKKQGYFIVYADKLAFQRSYFGSMAVAQMVKPTIGDFAYAVVYEGDVFKYGIENGRKTVIKHEQELGNVDKKKIVGAYCIVFDREGTPVKTEIMTIDEIHQAWKQSRQNPFDDKGHVKAESVHGKFTADMAIKTVVNKACKIIINSSSDNALLLERVNKAADTMDAAVVQEDIIEQANRAGLIEAPGVIEGEAEPGRVADDPVGRPTEPTAPCVCDAMIADGQKTWDCPAHGRYADGRFTSDTQPAQATEPQAGKRKPNF